jgi:hypothetical protein
MRGGLAGFRHAASIAALVALVPGPALADMTKDQCADANRKAQEFRRVGKLSAAREALQACVSASCPSLVRDDCARRLDELDKAQPTLAFEVQDASGDDLSAVRVTVDGKLLTERLDGAALPVDMGEHVFEFEVAGQPPIRRTLILTEGEKARRERIVLGVAASPAAGAVPAPSPPSQEASAPPASGADRAASAGGARRTQRILGLVAGGAGIAATGVGVVFGVNASSQWSTVQRECPSRTGCLPHAVSARNDAAASATVSTVSFIAAGLLFATGVTLFLTAPKDSQPAVGLTITPGGVSLAGTL